MKAVPSSANYVSANCILFLSLVWNTSGAPLCTMGTSAVNNLQTKGKTTSDMTITGFAKVQGVHLLTHGRHR